MLRNLQMIIRASLSVQCPPIFSAYLRSELLPSQQEIVAAAERSAALGVTLCSN